MVEAAGKFKSQGAWHGFSLDGECCFARPDPVALTPLLSVTPLLSCCSACLREPGPLDFFYVSGRKPALERVLRFTRPMSRQQIFDADVLIQHVPVQTMAASDNAP